MNESEIAELIPESFIKSSKYYVCVSDLEGYFVFLNYAYTKRFKRYIEQSKRLSVFTTIHPDDIPRVMDAVALLQEDPQKIVQVELKKPDEGECAFFWSSWEFSSFRNKNNEVAGILCVGHDITQAEINNLHIKKLSENIDAIIENIKEAYFIVDRDWNILKVNHVVEKTFATAKSKLIGKNLWQFVSQSDEYKYPNELKRVMYDLVSVNFEECIKELDRYFRIVAYPCMDGITILIRDITSNLSILKKLIQSQHELKAISNSTTDLNILINLKHEIVYFNKAARVMVQKMWGTKIKKGDSIWEYVFKTKKEEIQNILKKVSSGEIVVSNQQIIFDNNVKIWFQIKFFPIYADDNVLKSISVNFTYTDKHKRAEIRVNKQNEVLRKITFYQSHEVRAPLARILGLVDLLSHEKLSKDTRQLLQLMNQSAQDLNEIIHRTVEKANEIDYNRGLSI